MTLSSILNSIFKQFLYIIGILLFFSLIFVLRSQITKTIESSSSSSLSSSQTATAFDDIKILNNDSINFIQSRNAENDNYNFINFMTTNNKNNHNNRSSSFKLSPLSSANLNYENFFHSSKSKFLVPETIHLPFNSPSTIEDINAIPIAYGDFDSDKYTDIFMLSNHGKNIHLLKGYSCVDGRTILTFFGSRRCLSIVRNFHCNLNDRKIYNLVATDFTGHMQQDLLITIESSTKANHYDIVLVINDNNFDNNNETTLLSSSLSSEFNCDSQKNIVLINNAISEPFILDYDGDMISDFIVETDNCSLQLVLGGNFDNDNDIETIKSNNFICLSQMTKIKHLAKQHSSGFLNLNSYLINMTPDLFINGQNEFEYIYNIPGEGFQPNTNDENLYKFPENKLRGQSAFVDLNYDGHLEHLIPICLDDDDDIKSFKDCKQSNLMAFDEESRQWFPILENETLNSQENHSLTFSGSDLIYDYINIPVTLHIGDIDYDGYPDFATMLYDFNSKKTVAAIFLNKQSVHSNNTWNRVFRLDWISDYSDNVRMVSLFDIFNNGRLNLLITTEDSKTKALKLHTYDYYVEKSLYFSFLRANVISGLCTDKHDEHQCPQHLAYGGTPPGAMVCFAGPYSNDHCCAVQMSQTAHFALQPPYIIFGLGDVLNVINDLTISIANGKNSERVRKWNEIIPGSKLVIVPYEPDQMKNWEIRVFINMSIYSLVVLLFILLLCLILTCAIIILHFREKKEDRVDHQQYRNAWL